MTGSALPALRGRARTSMKIAERSPHAEQDTAAFESLRNSALREPEPVWLAELREKAFKSFSEHGLPDIHDEEWRYASLESMRRVKLSAPVKMDLPGGFAALKPFLPEESWPRLVFINGIFAPSLSNLSTAGPAVSRIQGKWKEREAQEMLADPNVDQNRPLSALNTVLFSDGLCLELEAGRHYEHPFVLVDIAAGSSPVSSALRHGVKAGAGSRASLVHVILELGGPNSFHNGVMTIDLAENTVLEHAVFRLGPGAPLRIAHVDCRQQKGSRFVSNVFGTGAGLFRNEMRVSLSQPQAECELNGLFLGSAAAQLNEHVRVDHLAPECRSQQLWKSVADGQSRVAVEGLVYVHPGAQKTDALQQIRSLLLSADAVADAKPQLEIYADDVKCSHGAALGQLDEDSIFYLQSRGIGRETAIRMLTEGFAADVTEKFSRPELRAFALAQIQTYFGTGAAGGSGHENR